MLCEEADGSESCIGLFCSLVDFVGYFVWHNRVLPQLVMEGLAGRDVFLFDPLLEPMILAAFSTPQGSNAASNRMNGFTFEQQRRLLEMQLKRDTFLATERERQWEWEKREREKDRELEYFRMKLEKQRLKLAREGIAHCGNPGSSPSEAKFKLLPRFNDRDSDLFFSPFEVLTEEPSVTAAGDEASLMCLVSESTDTVSEEFSLEQPQTCANDSHSPFVTQGGVALIVSDQKVPVRILHDTGVSESVLLFSKESDLCPYLG